MFYLGGMTFGYLTPHAPAPELNTAASAKGAKMPAPREEPFSRGFDAVEDRPILWPWHLFH